MREVTTFIMSWLAVTAIFFTTLLFDGLSIYSLGVKGAAFFVMLVGVVSAVYFIVIGLPTLYLMLRRQPVGRTAFILAALVASIPMLIFSIFSGEIEWVIATIMAGFIAGVIFAVCLANTRCGVGRT